MDPTHGAAGAGGPRRRVREPRGSRRCGPSIRTKIGAAAILAWALLAGCARGPLARRAGGADLTPPLHQVRGDDARAAIQAAHLRLDSVSRAGDARANAELFTEDAVVSLSTLQDVRGRPALLAALEPFYQRFAVQAHQLTTAELEVYGDSAYDRGRYLFISGPRGQAPKAERGRYAALWLRGPDGVWRIHRYLENLLPSGEPQ